MEIKKTVVRLKEIMKRRGMTVRELSERSGISIGTLYRRLRCKSFFSAEEIWKIAEVLEIKDVSNIFFNQ